jgi:hypothetical protein
MNRALLTAWLVGMLGALPAAAQEPWAGDSPPAQSSLLETPSALAGLGNPPAPPAACPAADPSPWRTPWGLVGLRVIPAGPRIAPNGQLYHPDFSLDFNFNTWIVPRWGIYLFAEMRLWGEKDEMGVTNGRDGGLGFSKREFDLVGGPAWNYYGFWELRLDGYTNNNLNRGDSAIRPAGFTDGFAIENRYYLSEEYSRLGQPGFDITQATFLSVAYYTSKNMVGNDGQSFEPGLQLRAYLIQHLWDWPAYVFADVTYISERSLRPKLLLFDLGLAYRPFPSWRQWEFRFGAENTADLQVGNCFNLWYVACRYIF